MQAEQLATDIRQIVANPLLAHLLIEQLPIGQPPDVWLGLERAATEQV